MMTFWHPIHTLVRPVARGRDVCVGCETIHTMPCGRIYSTFWHPIHSCATFWHPTHLPWRMRCIRREVISSKLSATLHTSMRFSDTLPITACGHDKCAAFDGKLSWEEFLTPYTRVWRPSDALHTPVWRVVCGLKLRTTFWHPAHIRIHTTFWHSTHMEYRRLSDILCTHVRLSDTLHTCHKECAAFDAK